MSNSNDDNIDYDSFGDIAANQNGIFGMAGLDQTLKKHDSVKHAITPQGLLLEFYCQGCGGSKQLMVEYPELVVLKYGVNPSKVLAGARGIMKEDPTDWKFVQDEQAWRPDMKCPECGFNVCLRVAAGEPEHHLTNARRRGFVNAAMEQQVSQAASQTAARIRAGGR